MTDNSSPPGAVTREVVLQVTFDTPVPTSRIEVRRIYIPAGVRVGLHVHNGPVVGNIVSGTVSFQIEGAPAVLLRPGDVFHEPAGERIASFDPLDEDVTFLAYFPLTPGQEPTLEMLPE